MKNVASNARAWVAGEGHCHMKKKEGVQINPKKSSFY